MVYGQEWQWHYVHGIRTVSGVGSGGVGWGREAGIWDCKALEKLICETSVMGVR